MCQHNTRNTVFKIILISLFACGLLSTPSVFAKTKKDLTVGVQGGSLGFHALKAPMMLSGSATIFNMVHEQLFEIDENGNVVNVLAQSVDLSEDAKSATIHLRKGITFHDGTSFDAHAVVSFWSQLIDPQNKYRARLFLSAIKGIEQKGSHSLEVTFRFPWPDFTKAFAEDDKFHTFIPSPKAFATGSQQSHPVGTGPYRFKEWKKKDRIVVEKNNDYWGDQKPKLDKVTIRIIPNGNSRYNSILSGETQLIHTDRGKSIVDAQKSKQWRVQRLEGNGAVTFTFNTRKAPLDDIRVRQAIAKAWDQSLYIKTIYKDTVPVANNWFPMQTKCLSTNYLSHDLKGAKELVEDYGKPVKIEVAHTSSPRGNESGLFFQQLMKRAGIEVTLKPQPIPQLIKNMVSRNFHVTSSIIPHSERMNATAFNLFNSKGFFNISGYSNPEVDKLTLIPLIFAEQKAADEAICQAVQIINTDAPFLYLNGRRTHLIYDPQLQGIPHSDSPFVLLAKAYFVE